MARSEVSLMVLRDHLKADLLAAAKEGDAARAGVIKVLLAAIANAEAVDLGPSQPREVQGWAEAPRRRLTDEDLARILSREAADRRAAAEEYESHGRSGEAARLRQSALWVEAYLGDLR
jgi:uncharacterized protein